MTNEICIAESMDINSDMALSLIERVRIYWGKRAKAFSEVRAKELQSHKAELWWSEIEPWLPESQKPLKCLDVGTGTGFLAMLLANHGCEVTAIDLSAEMLAEGEKLARKQNCQIEFILMDAGKLNFDAKSFDCLLSRNVTWTLTDPINAYREWARVLRPGGVLLNFDADYGSTDFSNLDDLKGNHAHKDIPLETLSEGENIRRDAPASAQKRPDWDLKILKAVGFKHCFCDRNLSERIFAQQDETYNPVPMFALRAVKSQNFL